MPTLTPNLSLQKPVVGSDADSWGAAINASLDILDAAVVTSTSDADLSNKTLAATKELALVTASAATGVVTVDLSAAAVVYSTANATANWTLNVRWSSTVTLNANMNVGESVTLAYMATQGATAYRMTGLQVDGAAVPLLWQGGAAPSAGSANSVDVYSITLIKRGANTWTALASATRFA